MIFKNGDSYSEAEVKIHQARETGSKTRHYEFGGPFGTFFLVFLLPFTVFIINYGCTKVY